MTVTARLEGVTRTFEPVTAVRDLDLELQAGRIYGLVGPNGSGKTTTLRMLLGLIRPDRGRVELFGAAPDDRSLARVGFVPEQRALPEASVVRDLLVFFARMRGFTRADAGARAERWIQDLELGDQAEARVDALSNGHQQKVQIALALMCEPEVILLDEPLTALDPTHQDLVFALLRRAAAGGAAVVLSTHRLREAQVLIEHVVMLAMGEKVLDRPLDLALQEAFEGTWRVRTTGDAGWVAGPDVTSVTADGRDLHVRLQPGASVAGLLARAAAAGAPVQAIEAVLPSLHDLYLARVSELERAPVAAAG